MPQPIPSEITSLEHAASSGAASLFTLGPIVTILVLAIMGLIWFIKSLLQDARDERKLNRDALVNVTTVITELKEIVRHVIK